MIAQNTMTTRMLLRRLAVISAVVVSLSVAGVAVRAAAAWTASSAPLTVTPVSATELSRQLAEEAAAVGRPRSATYRDVRSDGPAERGPDDRDRSDDD